ncbi:hypothetical protein H4V95_002316 [Arthrobacter sp. CAN_C5]|nr:hypothetical protein [Arthrobacter sp. CAN_C5]
MRGNAKTLRGGRHPDRDEQFAYLNAQASGHLQDHQSVISVDTNKKELVGEFKNKGTQWRPAEDAEQSRLTISSTGKGLGQTYGVYDVGTNTGWVAVGSDHDTAAFDVNTIRSWWNTTGHTEPPRCSPFADHRRRRRRQRLPHPALETEFAALIAETGLKITVCHLLRGTSKLNKIEHKLFFHISMNWRGQPLTSHEIIVNSIAASTTKT